MLDRDHLDCLSTHIGAAATRELLAEGRAELAGRLARLAQPAADEDLGTLAHQVSGLAGSLGLPLLARHAGRTAEAARAGRDPGCPLAALLDAAGPALDALADWADATRDRAGGKMGRRDPDT